MKEAKPLEKVVLEEEPNDFAELSQIIENGDSVMGSLSTSRLR